MRGWGLYFAAAVAVAYFGTFGRSTIYAGAPKAFPSSTKVE